MTLSTISSSLSFENGMLPVKIWGQGVNVEIHPWVVGVGRRTSNMIMARE